MKARLSAKLKQAFAIAPIFFILIGIWPNQAQGGVVLSNLKDGNYGAGVRFNNGTKQAIVFETNSSSWQMTSFTFAAYSSSGGPSDFTLRLYTASEPSPYQPNGNYLKEATASASSLTTNIISPNLISFSSLDWNLAANSKYDLEITSTSNFVRWGTNNSGFESQIFQPPSYLIYTDATGWNPNTGDLASEIQATATAVPEPATIITFSLCIIGVLIWRLIGIAR